MKILKSFTLPLIFILFNLIPEKCYAGIGPEWYKDTAFVVHTVSGVDEIGIDSVLIFRDELIYDIDGNLKSSYTSDNYVEYQPKSRVFIEINEELDSCFMDTFTFGVYLRVDYYDAEHNLARDSFWLEVNYDTSLGLWNVETASYIMDEAYWIKVKVKDFSNETFKKYVKIGYSIIPERYKDLKISDTTVTLNPIQFIDSTDEIKLSWQTFDGAEEYDVEWTWIDAINDLGNLDSTEIDTVIFKNSATRVTVKGLEYSISSAFEQGYVFFRVRAVGRNKNKPEQVTTSYWTDYNKKGEFVNFTSGTDQIQVSNSSQYKPLDNSLNWQYSSAYAEEGKRKEVISYYDGSFRNRQSVTRISTGMESIVAETIYDYEGRPAVNILPVPAFDHTLRFHANFNLSEVTKESYTKEDFDDSTGICAADVNGLDTLSGASRYYSSNNPDIGPFRYAGYIPDAQNFPMAVTEFMPDGSGRVKRQGGVGPDHQLETGHEVKYFYATPTEKELDRLFGNDVGYFEHYQKEMVVDPNGQASVSYKDLSGKVIATALIGDSPDRVTALDYIPVEPDMLDATFTSSPVEGRYELRVDRKIPVASDNTLYEFAYELEVPRITFDSLEDFCVDCVYELVFSLENDCGDEMLDGDPNLAGNQSIVQVIGKIGQDFDVDCEEGGLVYNFKLDSNINDTFISVYLDQGDYTLTKTLKISNSGFQYYLDEILNSSLVKSLSDFENEYYEKFDTASCEISCDSCFELLGTYNSYWASQVTALTNEGFTSEEITDITTNEYNLLFNQCKVKCIDSLSLSSCEGIRYSLIFDLLPGQQYASYHETDGGELTVEGLLDITNPDLDFNYKQYYNGSNWIDINYLDHNSDPITININGSDVSPNNLSPEQYIKYATLEWVENLMQFHPEYCRYQFCQQNEASLDYDRQMQAIQSFNEAYRKGYLDPLDTFDIVDFEDPLWQPGANSSMKADFYSKYFDAYEVLQFPVMSIPCSKISILEYSLLVHYSDWDLNDCVAASNWLDEYIQDDTVLLIDTTVICGERADAAWTMFKSIYLSQKNKFLDSLAKLNCNPVIPAGYVARTHSVNDIYDEGNIEEDEDTEYYEDLGEDKVLESCDTFCENQASYWIVALGGCDLPQNIIDQLIPEFKAVCKNACGPYHPIGAKDYPNNIGKRYTTNYYSFEEAFNAIVPDSCKSKSDCSVWSIAMPKSYKSDISKYGGLDTSCNANLLGGDTCYDDASHATKAFIKAQKSFEDSTICEDCITCDEFWEAWDSLSNRYNGPFIDSTWTLKEVLTNYMNDYFGFNLTYLEYKDFAGECHSFGKNLIGNVNGNSLLNPARNPSQINEEYRFDINDYKRESISYPTLYASISDFVPERNQKNYFNATSTSTDKYLDTCVCNQLQAFLDDYLAETGHQDQYDDIMEGSPSDGAIDSFENWMEMEYSGCLENVPGTSSFTEGLLKCRDFYSSMTDGADLSTGHWTTELSNELNTFMANDEFVVEAGDGADCITNCPGPHPCTSNNWWDCVEQSPDDDWYIWDTTDVSPTPCPTCPDCEDLESTIDSVLQVYSGYTSGTGNFNTYKACFLSSICQIRDPHNENLCSNCDAEGEITGTSTDSLKEIYNEIWEAFESNYNTIWERYSILPAFGKIEVNGELVMPEDTLEAAQKMDLLMQQYGSCIDLGCSYCYPSGEAICCKDTTVYYRKLLDLLNGFTETKSSYGNQFLSPSPYSLYPQLEEYYASPYYSGNCYQSVKYRIINNKMPNLEFVIEDDCSEKFYMNLTYLQNYRNEANFGRIIEFLDVQIIPTGDYQGCFGANRFIARARQENSIGSDIYVEIVGMMSDYYLFTGKWVEDSCDEEGPMLCNRPLMSQTISVPSACKTWKKMRAQSYAKIAYDNYRDSVISDFRFRYYDACMGAKDSTEMLYELKEYHYTLYYYDQAGNLIQTIPPKGVDLIETNNDFKQVANFREDSTLSPLYPSHTLMTQYTYNTFNEVRWQSTPDGGESEYYYDRLGRIVVSQNAKQAVQSIEQYSYTLYDSIGRIKEVGQITSATPMTISLASDTQDFNGWIANNVKDQITRTWYDHSMYNLSSSGIVQQNLRNRVVSTTFHSTDDTLYDHGVHYTYDIHGNVNSMVREICALHDILQGFKRIDYDYDLISSNVNYIYYQPHQDDQFTHRYYYDVDNRITSIETSNDGYHWDEDARYFYNKHGSLRRMELGELNVQGVDYAYTLQGWLKGVNSTTLNESRDIGQDGHTSGEHQTIARDVFGFSLHYYSTDFTPINGLNSNPSEYFLLDETGSGFAQRVSDLYNGNISRMVTGLSKLENSTIGKAYEYDQLNRISKAMTYSLYSSASNSWSSDTAASTDYYSSYSYDANGNIMSLTRYAEDARIMDQLDYHYTTGTNQLIYVDDQVHKDSFDYDIDDQSAGNYQYDEIGNLVYDYTEFIDEITWTVYGKIKEIKRDTNRVHDKSDLQFEYGADGHRVAKHVTDTSGTTISTWYIRDASGNIMATYTRDYSRVIDTNKISAAEIYSKLEEDKSLASRLTYLHEDLNWSSHINDVSLDNTLTEVDNANVEEDILHHFSPQNFVTSSIFNSIYSNLSDTQLISAMRYDGYTDSYLIDALCAQCADSLLTHILKYDYQGALEWLQSNDIARFDVLKDLYAPNPPPPNPPLSPPEQVTEIMNNSTESNSVYQIGQSMHGHDCDQYKNLYYHLLGFDTDDSRDLMDGMPNLKTCLANDFTNAEIIGALISYLGNEAIWDEVLNYSTSSALDYVEDLRDSVPDQYLYYATLEINTDQFMSFAVSLMANSPSITYWLNKINSRFGNEYYNEVMAYLAEGNSSSYWNYSLDEHHIYGASRVGIEQSSLIIAQQSRIGLNYNYISAGGDSIILHDYSEDSIIYRLRGDRRYELSNHLGNVLAVITDRRIQSCGMGEVMYYSSQMLSVTDYYPGGMQIKERSYSAASYRFGFQGQEQDDEIKGSGNSIEYKYRIHDPRIVRFLSVDPLTSSYPWYSPYQFSGNRPIDMVELEGLEPAVAGKEVGEHQKAAYTGEGQYNGQMSNWYWDGNQWNASLNEFIVKPKEFSGPVALYGTQDYRKPGEAIVEIGQSNTNYWKDLPESYNCKSGYYYTEDDLKLRLKYQQMGGEVWRWIKMAEEQGEAIPLTSASHDSYYGATMTAMIMAEAVVPSGAGLAAGAQGGGTQARPNRFTYTPTGRGTIRFTQSAADNFVVGLKNTQGGNVTVMKNGNPVFRVHQPGTHGHVNATFTKFNANTNPHTGRTRYNPQPKVSDFDEEAFTILQQASRGEGGYYIVTRGGR